MNEKIKILAEQAGIKINEGQETHLWWLERFAELVRQDERELVRQYLHPAQFDDTNPF